MFTVLIIDQGKLKVILPWVCECACGVSVHLAIIFFHSNPHTEKLYCTAYACYQQGLSSESNITLLFLRHFKMRLR